MDAKAKEWVSIIFGHNRTLDLAGKRSSCTRCGWASHDVLQKVNMFIVLLTMRGFLYLSYSTFEYKVGIDLVSIPCIPPTFDRGFSTSISKNGLYSKLAPFEPFDLHASRLLLHTSYYAVGLLFLVSSVNPNRCYTFLHVYLAILAQHKRKVGMVCNPKRTQTKIAGIDIDPKLIF